MKYVNSPINPANSPIKHVNSPIKHVVSLSDKAPDFFNTICQLSDKTRTALGHVNNSSESIGMNKS